MGKKGAEMLKWQLRNSTHQCQVLHRYVVCIYCYKRLQKETNKRNNPFLFVRSGKGTYFRRFFRLQAKFFLVLLLATATATATDDGVDHDKV